MDSVENLPPPPPGSSKQKVRPGRAAAPTEQGRRAGRGRRRHISRCYHREGGGRAGANRTSIKCTNSETHIGGRYGTKYRDEGRIGRIVHEACDRADFRRKGASSILMGYRAEGRHASVDIVDRGP